MMQLSLLTDNGFKFISEINNDNILDSNFNLKNISYINRFENFYFPCQIISLVTGLNFTVRSYDRFQGLIFEPDNLKNDLDLELISKYNVNDYIYTKYNKENLTVRHKFEQIQICNNLTSKFYLENVDKLLLDVSSPDLIKDLKVNKPVHILPENGLHKFLAISLVRGKLKTLSADFKTISYKFSHSSEKHLAMKSDLIRFFKDNDLSYNLVEYNKYCYINYSDLTLTSLVESFLEGSYTSLTEILQPMGREFLIYLYEITGNTYYLDRRTYLYFKKLAYDNNLVLAVKNNSIKSNHKFSLVSQIFTLEEEDLKLIPDVIYLEDGYLTRITNIKSENIKGDADYLTEYLLVC